MKTTPFIKNAEKLAVTVQRRQALAILETGLKVLQPRQTLGSVFSLAGSILKVKTKRFDLNNYRRVFLLGFGKGSAALAKLIEEKMAGKLTAGCVIDATPAKFNKIKFTLGAHPLPSKINQDFTQRALRRFSKLTSRDLVLVVVCGGGSAMLVGPAKVSLAEKIAVNKILLRSGAAIREMNIVRKHLSLVKGGGLAKVLYPATALGLIFSDVPGDDLAVVASGPTVKDSSTFHDVVRVIKKYDLETQIPGLSGCLVETPKQGRYFAKVHNFLMAGNKIALAAMARKARLLGFEALVLARPITGQARTAADFIFKKARPGKALIAGGETTVTVKGRGRGGRNQELVLAALTHPAVEKGQAVAAALNTDGWDNTPFAGAIGDRRTLEQSRKLKLSLRAYLDSNDSYNFFKKTKDGIITGRLPSNFSDLIVVLLTKN